MELFMAYHWPGNIRELEHCIEHAFILCQGEQIEVGHLPPEIAAMVGEELLQVGEDLDAEALRTALQQTDGNKAKAARLLGISRRTIYRKLEEFQHDS
jgi:transcriptional regulator of acetoin/glycerol metabolism